MSHHSKERVQAYLIDSGPILTASIASKHEVSYFKVTSAEFMKDLKIWSIYVANGVSIYVV